MQSVTFWWHTWRPRFLKTRNMSSDKFLGLNILVIHQENPEEYFIIFREMLGNLPLGKIFVKYGKNLGKFSPDLYHFCHIWRKFWGISPEQIFFHHNWGKYFCNIWLCTCALCQIWGEIEIALIFIWVWDRNACEKCRYDERGTAL